MGNEEELFTNEKQKAVLEAFMRMAIPWQLRTIFIMQMTLMDRIAPDASDRMMDAMLALNENIHKADKKNKEGEEWKGGS